MVVVVVVIVVVVVVSFLLVWVRSKNVVWLVIIDLVDAFFDQALTQL